MERGFCFLVHSLYIHTIPASGFGVITEERVQEALVEPLTSLVQLGKLHHLGREELQSVVGYRGGELS